MYTQKGCEKDKTFARERSEKDKTFARKRCEKDKTFTKIDVEINSKCIFTKKLVKFQNYIIYYVSRRRSLRGSLSCCVLCRAPPRETGPSKN